MTSPQPENALPPQAPAPRRSRSIIWKALLIGALTLLLLIPLALINALIFERQNTRDKVVGEISQTWADEQHLIGPLLVIPYQKITTSEDEKGRKRIDTTRALAYLLPETYQVFGRIDPEVRYRSIYQSVVYRSRLDIQGRFNVHSLNELKLTSDKILWRDAFIAIGIPSVKGIESRPSFTWLAKASELLPGVNGASFRTGGLYAPVSVDSGRTDLPFRLTMTLRGNQKLTVAPIGKQSAIRLASSWTSPSFTGGSLPGKRAVNRKGFDATWEIPYFSRAYGQALLDGESVSSRIEDSAVGVELLTPVDSYRQSDRAVKYGILFLALTFTTYFLFEIVGRQRLHPFQYLLVGLAITLFYLLLIALSETLHFGWAYLLASVAIIALITLYSKAILGAGRHRAPLIIGTLLTALYGYLYILLRLEDWSLLFGALGLLAALAIMMYVTRRIDWYNE